MRWCLLALLAACTPTERPRSNVVVQIAAGGEATCVRTDSGELACTGWNYFGQLGHRAFEPQAKLGPIEGLPPVDDVVMGQGHVCALARDTTVWCWGSNYLGQLGDGTTVDRPRPERVAGLDGVRAIAAGVHVTCALRAKEVLCWGDAHFGQIPIRESYATRPVVVPVSLGARETLFREDEKERPVEIRAGGATICVVTAGRVAHCWGGVFRAKGDGGTTAPSARTDVEMLALGAEHACARGPYGVVSCWGNDRFGQTMKDAPELRDVRGLALGTWHSCAIDSSDHVLCWGLDNVTRETQSNPRRVAGIEGATMIAAGNSHTCAIARGGLFCWGAGQHGQLGDGELMDRASPVQMAR
jgi:alpha-tubulin suppressor-like RCC1 family protein